MNKTNRLSLILIVCLFAFSFNAANQDIVGVWKTIDDKTGNPRSHVEIEIRNGKLYGVIQKIIPGPGEDPDPVCEACKGDLHGEKVLGMNIINELQKNSSGEWEGKKGILDPESGNVYDCKLWLENPNKLNVRGYVGFFFRTQTWQRVP